MKYQDVEKRLLAAQQILSSGSVDRPTFDSLRGLLRGINPKIDKTLDLASKALTHAEQLYAGDIIDFTVAGLPALSERDKKRKKGLLLFFKFWDELKAEVGRVQAEFD